MLSVRTLSGLRGYARDIAIDHRQCIRIRVLHVGLSLGALRALPALLTLMSLLAVRSWLPRLARLSLRAGLTLRALLSLLSWLPGLSLLPATLMPTAISLASGRT